MNKKQNAKWNAEFDSIRVLSKSDVAEYELFDMAISLMKDLMSPNSGFLARVIRVGWKLTIKLRYQNRNIIWLKKELKKAKKIK